MKSNMNKKLFKREKRQRNRSNSTYFTQAKKRLRAVFGETLFGAENVNTETPETTSSDNDTSNDPKILAKKVRPSRSQSGVRNRSHSAKKMSKSKRVKPVSVAGNKRKLSKSLSSSTSRKPYAKNAKLTLNSKRDTETKRFSGAKKTVLNKSSKTVRRRPKSSESLEKSYSSPMKAKKSAVPISKADRSSVPGMIDLCNKKTCKKRKQQEKQQGGSKKATAFQEKSHGILNIYE